MELQPWLTTYDPDVRAPRQRRRRAGCPAAHSPGMRCTALAGARGPYCRCVAVTDAGTCLWRRLCATTTRAYQCRLQLHGDPGATAPDALCRPPDASPPARRPPQPRWVLPEDGCARERVLQTPGRPQTAGRLRAALLGLDYHRGPADGAGPTAQARTRRCGWCTWRVRLPGCAHAAAPCRAVRAVQAGAHARARARWLLVLGRAVVHGAIFDIKV